MWIIAAAIVDHAAAIFLLLPSRSDTASISVAKRIDRLEKQMGLMFDDTELTDTIASLNGGIPHSDGREEPLIVVTAVAFVHHTHVVGLDNAEVLEGGATGNDMGFIALGKLHRYTKRNKLELASLH